MTYERILTAYAIVQSQLQAPDVQEDPHLYREWREEERTLRHELQHFQPKEVS